VPKLGSAFAGVNGQTGKSDICSFDKARKGIVKECNDPTKINSLSPLIFSLLAFVVKSPCRQPEKKGKGWLYVNMR
jgi:hypothetical protein